MFALLANDVLYLKADEIAARAFEAEGMGPFTYTSEGRPPVAMSYWEVPPRLLEEPDELAERAREAHRIACAGKKAKTKAKTKRKRR
jgi:DNA transformation protein